MVAWGESGNVFAVTKLFSDDPKVPAWKESSVARWRAVESARGGVSASPRVTQLGGGGSQQPLILPRRNARPLKTRLILFTKCQVNTAADTQAWE